MSRRKQEKPQPRKLLVKGDVGEMDQDLITCGVCGRIFPLGEIVRFIQHKVSFCNKENSCLNKLFGVIPDDSDSEEAYVALPNRPPPESADPSTLKNALAKDTPTKDTTEPCGFFCSTCKQAHSSAWALLQHVQTEHGLNIYVDSSSECQNMHFAAEANDCQSSAEECVVSLRAPLLERQLESSSTMVVRAASQELRLDLLGLASAANKTPSSPPPLIEVKHLDTSPQTSSMGASYEPRLDFYSKRLRELAGATSPNALLASAKLLQPDFKAVVKEEPTQNSTPQFPQSSASSTSSENPVSPKQNNPRACEFCGKTFRFMSNLIVHRRSHTGEKPFKCHVCNHACTQASKLKRHMKTHKRRKKSEEDLNKNGFSQLEYPDRHTNGDLSDHRGNNHNDEEPDEEDEEEIDVEDDDREDDDDHYKKLTVDLGPDDGMVAEDLSKKSLKNGTVGNNGIAKEEKKENHTMRHSLLSEVMEKIGLANIQQYSEAYKQALKESSLCKDRYSDGSASNDGGHYLERPSREGTRSAGQSPLGFHNSGLLSAFDQSIGIKRVKLEDTYREKEDTLYAGLWVPSVSSRSVSSYKDLYSADGSDRRKSKTESALSCVGLGCGRSPSPRPGTSSNSLLKPKDQRRNDTCEFCGKVFKNCSNLTVHRRSHTGEKPYKCELCSYACAQSSKLTRHMKTHGRMGKDVYRCRFCDMPFSVPSTLEKHMRKCVVSQSVGSSYLLAERELDVKELTSS